MIAATRRRFLNLIGASPLAAKMAADKQIASLLNADISGLGAAGIYTGYGTPSNPPSTLSDEVPWPQKIIASSKYIDVFGLPEFVEFRLREEAKRTNSLDPDIANKKTWSMAYMVTVQRQRNYERGRAEIERAGWAQQGRSVVKSILGFEWPW